MKNKLLNIIGICAVVFMTVWAFFMTRRQVMEIGIKPENMNTSVKPGNDFYDYATKGWRDNNPIPDDYTRYGSFDVWAGNVERAPEIFRKTGCEWLYRTVTQPKRIKRIYKTLPMFLFKVIIEALQNK